VCGADRFRPGLMMVSAGNVASVVISASGKRRWTGRIPDGVMPTTETCDGCGHVLLFVGG